MKRTLLLSVFIVLCAGSLCGQGIQEEIAQHDDPAFITIAKGRDLLVEKFIADDFDKVAEIRSYLQQKAGSDNYRAFYPTENKLILYWTQEYEELLRPEVISDTYVQDRDYQKYSVLQRLPDNLEEVLRDMSLRHLDVLQQNILDADISPEEKDILLLDLNAVLNSNDFLHWRQNEINAQADVFLVEYPQSIYTDYVRTSVRHVYVPRDWGYSFEFFSGYGLYAGRLGNNYTNDVPIGVAFDVCYKNFTLYLRDYIGFNKTKRDLDYSIGTLSKGSRLTTVLPEASLGYAIFENNRFKISPFAGIGGRYIGVNSNEMNKIPELEELDRSSVAYVAGLNLDIKIGSDYIEYPFIRIRYAYVGSRFGTKYGREFSGNMHYVTIGFGLLERGVKRSY